MPTRLRTELAALDKLQAANRLFEKPMHNAGAAIGRAWVNIWNAILYEEILKEANAKRKTKKGEN